MAALLLWLAANLAWCLAQPGSRWLIYPAWALGGAATAGIILGKLGLLLKLLPSTAASAGAGVHTAATSIASTLGPLAAGWWLTRNNSATSLDTYHHFFAAQPIVLIVAMALLWRSQPSEEKVLCI